MRSFSMPSRRTCYTLFKFNLYRDRCKAWRDDGPTGSHDLWEMHVVWMSVEKTGGMLIESYFLNDPVTVRSVRFRSSRLGVN